MADKQASKKSSTEKLGYPIMEGLIETEDFTKVNATMSACYDLLERQLKQKGGLAKQKKIRQSLQAYDLTIDLIRFLLKMKYDMAAKEAKTKDKTKK